MAIANSTSTSTSTTTATATSPPSARLPHPPGVLSPAQTEVDGPLAGVTLTETESCAGCHADAASQWTSSAHAFASFNNPVYRVVVDRFRRRVGREQSRFCAGCHDVALLVDGAMDAEVAPDDSRAHAGVTCRVCHGIEEARPDGNGSYVLASSPIVIPRDGDEASLAAHRARMALSPLRTPALCGSCHRSFLSAETGDAAHLVGQDELGEWHRSAFAGSLANRVDEPVDYADCRTCHMPLEAAPLGDAAAKRGKIRSHRFPGGQTWLAAMRQDGAQVDATRALLRTAATIDVAAVIAGDGARTLPADGAQVTRGDTVTFDVVVRSEQVGHRFPGGVLDAQDTWIELSIRDAHGSPVAEAGALHEATGSDPTAHRLRALQVDEHGEPLLLRETDRFRAPAYNRTIGARDAQVVRYRWSVPGMLRTSDFPLEVTARLRHRSRDLALARAVCAEAASARAKLFAHEVSERTGVSLRSCVAEPVTDIARTDVWIGPGSEGRAYPERAPAWRRLFDHALGLVAGQQEVVEEARPSLTRALDLAPTGDDDARAMVLFLLADVAVRQGRTGEALGLLEEAEALAPGHPAIASARGRTLASVWRWGESVGPFERAARASPLDDGAWSRVALAYASAGDARAALVAAARGLELVPRDSDDLRVQALALETLGAPNDEVGRARDEFARWRAPDDAPAVKSACAKRFAWCALERIPVHVHEMRTAKGR